ncbi:MAG: glycosyltransferase, partial [Candidatus Thermoplasmatota archaeon]|nr:glycosyltransferase [Candidatus Thermoplasmatota archaeon]
DYEFILFDHREFLGRIIKDAWTLDKLYWKKDKKLLKTYYELKKIIQETKADILCVGADNVYHPEFIKSLDVYTVLQSTDDPNSSYLRTVPYIWAFDHISCVNVCYHRDMPVKMTDKLLEWGAKQVSWFPMGVEESLYDPKLKERDILNKDRKIDILYVGAPYREKNSDLIKLKKAFGRKFKLFGPWGSKLFVYYLLHGKWKWVNPLPQNLFVDTYQDTKIGINLHQSGELGNGRLYQLPINGVMQVCDCSNILHEVFEPGKEIVGFNSIDESIELIKYYLEHDDERKKIAVAGFKRAKKNYLKLTVYQNLLKEIKRGMLNKGIKQSKDGSKIKK